MKYANLFLLGNLRALQLLYGLLSSLIFTPTFIRTVLSASMFQCYPPMALCLLLLSMLAP